MKESFLSKHGILFCKDKFSNDLNKVEQSCGFWDFDLFIERCGCLYISTYVHYCCFSDNIRQGGWSREGVEFIQDHSSDVSAVCHSYHLTSFAVLVSAKHEPEQVILQAILWHASYMLFHHSQQKLKH